MRAGTTKIVQVAEKCDAGVDPRLGAVGIERFTGLNHVQAQTLQSPPEPAQ